MKPVKVGQSVRLSVEARPEHTADALGNRGVTVLSTPALIGFVEAACTRAIRASFDDGEASVGTAVNVAHRAPAPVGATLIIEARVKEVEGNRILFAVEARHGNRLVMEGTHSRAVVNLKRFLGRRGR